MTLARRLRHLEDRQRDERWCRCPFSMERFKREVLPLLAVDGARTPDRCGQSGGAKPVIEVRAMESAMWWNGDES